MQSFFLLGLFQQSFFLFGLVEFVGLENISSLVDSGNEIICYLIYLEDFAVKYRGHSILFLLLLDSQQPLFLLFL